MIKSNGGIIGPDNVTTGGAFGSASGVFKLGEVTNLIKESKWPTQGPQGFQVANSIRFDDGSSSYLQKSASGGNRRTFTFSTWVKRSTLLGGSSGYNTFFSSDEQATNSFRVTFRSESNDDKLMTYFYTGSQQMQLITTREFRDVSAWYHIVIAVDTTQGTASNRTKLYVNGVQETSFSTETYPSQNLEMSVNQSGAPNRVGAGTSLYFDGYMSETVLIDGQQLDPTSFGEFNSQTGIWVPKVVTGLTFGTNGFYLNYQDSAELGTDANGGTALAETNLTSLDQSTDTCSTNFATLNPLIQLTDATLSEGNLQVAYGSAGSRAVMLGTFGLSSGKWYCEFKVSASSASPCNGLLGIINGSDNSSMGTYLLQNNSVYQGAGYQFWDGNKNINQTGSSFGATIAAGDIVGMAIDMDNKALYFSKNGTYQASGNPASGSSKTGAIDFSSLTDNGFWFIGVSDASGTQTMTYQCNFGSPMNAISSGNTDGNGFGNFEYAVPSGYLSLNTKNLAAVLA